MATSEQVREIEEGKRATVKKAMPALRWELVNNVYEKLDQLLSDEVNANKLTFVEIEAVMKLMELKLLKCEVKHLVGISVGELLYKINNGNSSREGKQDKTGECYK